MPQFGIKECIDILLVATIMFGAYRLLRRSGAVNLFWGILTFVAAWFLVSGVFQLELTGALFDRIISVGAIALIVIFQDEIRTFINRVGARMQISALRQRISRKKQQEVDKYITELALACSNMAKSKTGALIVLQGEVPLGEYNETGEPLDARVSARLVENIFFKNTPLHDGALIIAEGRLVSAACILPVSKDPTIPQHYGLRHRAALGISEKTDALVIVVSEETGHISVAEDGAIREINPNELTHIIANYNNK